MLRNKFFSTGIILLLAITVTQASFVDGVWEVNRTGELVEIRTTNYGLKAKFVQSSSWEHYDRIKRDIYEDRKGNRYYIKNESRISWESRDGRRVINLEKSRARTDRRGRSYDFGNPRNQHTCSAACGSSCSFAAAPRYDDGLSGTWVSRWRNLIAYVEFDGYSVRMKTNKSRKWTTYRRTGSRKLTFEDQWGNRLRFKRNGKLQWRRADGRRNVDFRQEYL